MLVFNWVFNFFLTYWYSGHTVQCHKHRNAHKTLTFQKRELNFQNWIWTSQCWCQNWCKWWQNWKKKIYIAKMSKTRDKMAKNDGKTGVMMAENESFIAKNGVITAIKTYLPLKILTFSKNMYWPGKKCVFWGKNVYFPNTSRYSIIVTTTILWD